MQFEPIGKFTSSAAARKYDAPRQGVFAGNGGVIELLPGRNLEMALRDLDGFERIWVLFAFDRNGEAWRPTARPPVAAPGRGRVGVFASRSPYRPNPIGMSCVRLLKVDGLSLEVDEADLLDGTPVLDIKPYIPRADAFPGAKAGWVDEQRAQAWRVIASEACVAQARIIKDAGGPDLVATAAIQLANEPFDGSRKRVERVGDDAGVLALRMFRVEFAADSRARTVTLLRIRSGYTAAELAAPDDPYADKHLHSFLAVGGQASV